MQNNMYLKISVLNIRMYYYDIIGYIGIFTASISLCPQIYQILKTQQVRDVNLYFFILSIISELLYISYGIIKKDYVMVGSTIPPMVSQIVVIYLLLKYKNNEIENSEH